MKANLLDIIILPLFFVQVFAHKTQKNETQSEYRTFLVKTQLSKEQLKTLLCQGECQKSNLKKKVKQNKEENIEKKAILNPSNIVVEVNKTIDEDDTLEKQIEDEIRADALHPLDEFYVNQNNLSEVQTLVVKTKTRFIDSLYEKKFGKVYAYLTLFLFVFIMIYYRKIIFNQKLNYSKATYRNIFEYEYDSINEYMLDKTN